MTKLTGYNLIGLEGSARGEQTFLAINPSTLIPLDTTFYEATFPEIDRAIVKAEEAFLVYKSIHPEARARFLETIAEEILELDDTLIRRCMDETALPEARLIGERMRTVNQLRLFASVVRDGSWVDARIDTATPDRRPFPKPDIRQMQIPLGPVGIFGASNFPLAFSVAGGDTSSAFAAGCTVVFKAHPLHPGTSELVGKAIQEAIRKTDLPDGIFSLIHGPSEKVGMTIVEHHKIAAIGFTGSFNGGKAIFDAANKRDIPIPVFAEMGSINPVFILPGALKERNKAIAKELVGSFTLGVGQFCTNPGLVVTLKSSESDQFYQALKNETAEVGSGTMLSERIRMNYRKGVKKLKESKGIKVLASSNTPEKENNVKSRVFSTDADFFLRNKDLAEEVFGPSTLIVAAQSKEEMINVAKNLEGHLTATIQGTEQDLAGYTDLIQILERKVGRLIFNGFPTGVEVCHSMVHGGPFPATTASQSTSVGTAAIRRFSRPVCYQDFPQAALPDQLKNENSLNIWRLVNGALTKERIG